MSAMDPENRMIGQLWAMRTVVTVLLGRYARDHGGLEEIHSLIVQGIQKTCSTVDPGADEYRPPGATADQIEAAAARIKAAADQIEAAAVNEIDEMFSTAATFLKPAARR